MAGSAVQQSESSTVSPEGRVVIPAAMRKALNLTPGTAVTFRLEDDRIVLSTRESALRELRSLFAHLPSDRLLSEELIAERRAEAARESVE